MRGTVLKIVLNNIDLKNKILSYKKFYNHFVDYSIIIKTYIIIKIFRIKDVFC